MEQREFDPILVRRAIADRAAYERRRLIETCIEAGITKTFVMQMMSKELDQEIRQILDLGEQRQQDRSICRQISISVFEDDGVGE